MDASRLVEATLRRSRSAGQLLPPSARDRIKKRLSTWSDKRLQQHSVESWDTPVGRLAAGPVPAVPRADDARTPQGGSAPSGARGSASSAPEGPSDRGLRCLIVTDVLDVGGLDEFVAFLARGMTRQGVTICVAKTGVVGGRLGDQLTAEGIRVVETRTGAGLHELIEEFAPHVISAHAPKDWAFDVAAAAGIPVVETLHGLPTPVGSDWAVEPARSRGVAMMVAVSDLVRRQYLRGNPGYDADRVRVIPNGVNLAGRPRVDREAARAWLGLDSEFVFVTLARLHLQKNTYGLVAAFAEVARSVPDAHLVLAGRLDDSLYATHVLSLRSRLPIDIARRIHVRDNTFHVPALLAASDAFVMDSFFEGWSLASMEALAAGLPVVISDVGGAREQLGAPGERGYLVANPLGDAELATWPRAGAAKFADQPNKAELVARMTEVAQQRRHWADRREDLAAESRERFSPDACLLGHLEALTDAAHALQRG